MEQLLGQGLELMVIGMGVVFIFLIILVFITDLMSRILNRFFPEAVVTAPAAVAQTPAGDSSVDDLTVRIIQDAIQQHRARQSGARA